MPNACIESRKFLACLVPAYGDITLLGMPSVFIWSYNHLTYLESSYEGLILPVPCRVPPAFEAITVLIGKYAVAICTMFLLIIPVKIVLCKWKLLLDLLPSQEIMAAFARYFFCLCAGMADKRVDQQPQKLCLFSWYVFNT